MNRIGVDSVSFSGSLNDSDINYYLLYWDKIVMPANDMFNFKIKNEEELLKTKILERPVVRIGNWTTNSKEGSFDPFIAAQSIVANDLIANDKLDIPPTRRTNSCWE